MSTLKIAIFAAMFVLLILNFLIGTIAEKIFKKELSQTELIAIKSVFYVVFLAGAVYIIFLG